MEGEYQAPDIGAVEKRYKWSLLWIKVREPLRKSGLVIWAVVDVLLILFVLWTMIDTYLISYEGERALFAGMALNQSNRHQVVLSTVPEALKLSDADVFALGDGRFDFYAQVENKNENYWIEFDYYFEYSGELVTESRSGYVYPLSSKPLIDLAVELNTNPQTTQVVIENVEWHFVDPHLIPDFAAFLEDRLDFEIVETDYVPSLDFDTVVARSSFTVENQTAYGYWEPVFYVLLYRGTSVAGVTQAIIPEFAPGDERTVEQNWFGTLPAVTKVEVIPEVDLLDTDSYLPLEGDIQEDLH